MLGKFFLPFLDLNLGCGRVGGCAPRTARYQRVPCMFDVWKMSRQRQALTHVLLRYHTGLGDGRQGAVQGGSSTAKLNKSNSYFSCPL